MKSIILVVLLALSYSALAKPDYGLEREESFQALRRAGSKTTYSSSASTEADDESALESAADSAVDTKDLEPSSDKDDKVDCNCNKGKPKITYGPEQIVKGKPETYIHHQPKIIVRQPPTHVRIEHQPTVIQPSTIVIHRNGKTIRRPVIYQHLPRDVRVHPVYVKWVKPIIKKIVVEKKGDAYSKVGEANNSQQDGYSVIAQGQNSKQEGYSVVSGDYKSQQDDQSVEYNTQTFDGESYGAGSDGAESYGAESYGGESYGGESYGEESYGGESYGAGSYGPGSYSESFNEHAHEHESFRANLKVKETEKC